VPPAVPPDHRHRVPFRAELPRSPVGRVLERELRAERPTAITWDAEASGIAYDKR
jgi:carnitine-CoA ligase